MPNDVNPRNIPRTIRYVGALMAKVTKAPSTSGSPIEIGPLEKYPERDYHVYFNHMRADIEANRLEITSYDSDYDTYHIIQTPFYSLDCIQRASMNLHVPIMKIYIRLRATLKRSDGQGEIMYFIKDFEVDKQLSNELLPIRNLSTNLNAIPPFSNYTIPPNTSSSTDIGGNVYPANPDLELGLFNPMFYTLPGEVTCNHTISTSSNYYVTVDNDQQLVTFRAGSSVTLNPKFEAVYGSSFLATVDWGYYSIDCNLPVNITNYDYGADCYSTNIAAQRSLEKPLIAYESTENLADVYPNPATTRLTVTISDGQNIKSIKVLDASGRIYDLPVNIASGNRLQVDVSGLSNGSYFVTILTGNGVLTHKFAVIR